MAYKRKSTKRPARKYSRKPKRTGTVARLTRQVKNLQIMCKPEKKYTDVNQDEVAYIGQYAATVTDDGAWYSTISPTISGGSNASSRVGNKINLVSAYIQIQLRQMSQTINPIRS